MKEMKDPKSKEQFDWEQDIFENSLKNQERNKDYDYDHLGNRNKCDDCGNNLNSRGHCPRCDY